MIQTVTTDNILIFRPAANLPSYEDLRAASVHALEFKINWLQSSTSRWAEDDVVVLEKMAQDEIFGAFGLNEV